MVLIGTLTNTFQIFYLLFFQAREEKKKHKKRMKKLESLYRQNLRRMRKTLETKLEKSSLVLEEQKQEKQKRISK